MRLTTTALVLCLFAAAGLAANVSCTGNASGSWYITNKNVTCEDAYALNMTGNTVYVYGASNVTFSRIINSSININVYDTANLTLNNVTSGTVSTSGSSTIIAFNESNLSLVTAYFDGLAYYLTNTTLYLPHATQSYFYGSTGRLTRVTSASGGCYGMHFNTTNLTINGSVLGTACYGLRFYNNTFLNMDNTTLSNSDEYDPVFYDTVHGNISGSTIASLDITDGYNMTDEQGYLQWNTSGGLRFNVSNYSTVTFLPASVGTNVTRINNVNFSVSGSPTFSGSSVFINSSNFTLSGHGHYYFSATSMGITNSIFSGTLCIGQHFSATQLNVNDSTFNEGCYGIEWTAGTANATNITLSTAPTFSGIGTLYNKSWLRVYANDSTGKALRNVSITAYNTTGEAVDAVGTTDAFGWLNMSVLYTKQNATRQYFYSMTVNSTAAEALNQSSQTMSTVQVYNALFPDRFSYVVGSALVGGFTANVTAYYGNSSLKPWNGSRQVELRSGVATLVANFSWNFSAGDLNVSNITITRSDSDRYVGINGTNVTPLVVTVWVPVWGKECNVRVCAGKANYSHCAAGDWAVASSVQSGEYCVLSVNGTVVQDRPTAVTTKMVIKVPGWDAPLAGALFAFALLVFVLRGTARPARRGRRAKISL